MRERPILFQGAMVRALLAGTKTQTRRVVKPWSSAEPSSKPVPADLHYLPDRTCYRSTCPYGQPGDRLWVREAFAVDSISGGKMDSLHFRATPKIGAWRGDPFGGGRWNYDVHVDLPWQGAWKPSIHMPRWASRISLEVTAVRVERLQDISEADARFEGTEPHIWDASHGVAELIDWPLKEDANPYRNGYALLWEQINGPGSWAANPWVWVVEFRRLP